MSKGIYKPYKIKNLELRNRAVMAPMCMCEGDNFGYSNDFHYIHYTTRAMGGVGAIILEATAVESRGRISGNDLGIWEDGHIDGLKKIVEGIKKYGAAAGIQLGHAGRKCGAEGEEIIAPSPIPFSDVYGTPMEMGEKELMDVKIAFREGARRANEAGFDFIELHGAHGYLLSEFLSPLSNKREDNYGGSLENRAAYVVEVIREVKKVWPSDKVLAIRVSAEDYKVDGNHKEDMAKIIDILKKEGIDLVDVSTGAVVSDGEMNIFSGYQIPHGEYIKNSSNIPVIAGGLILNSKMAEEIIENNRADLVYYGRLLLREPFFLINEGKELEDVKKYIPKTYSRGIL